MSNLEAVLFSALNVFRWVGIVAIAIVAMAVLISEGAKSKLSPGKILTVAASGLLAGALFWALPTLIGYARSDTIVQIVPEGGLYR